LQSEAECLPVDAHAVGRMIATMETFGKTWIVRQSRTQLLLPLRRKSKSPPSFAKNAKEGCGTLTIFIDLRVSDASGLREG
jgi:hypothetical protein